MSFRLGGPFVAGVVVMVALVTLAGCAGPETGGAVVGRVSDQLTGAPLAGATVRAEGVEEATVTDPAGRFVLPLPTGAHRLHFGARGYLGLTRLSVVVREASETVEDVAIQPEAPDDDAVLAFMHERAEARRLRDDPEDPALRPEVAAFLAGRIDEAELLGSATVGDGEIGGARAALSSPPATVRIWRRSIDGASASCSGRIDVIPLEDYVKGVLPHEWIASWHDESLRAGSLAIRTYVWNWVLRGGKYDCADLDDTTASQVYRDDRVARASAAVDATRGQGIVRDGSLVSGEYSAEHGGVTADGVVDRLCEGRTRSGHGRGMCQWGTQRWALDGQTHGWMASHYWPGATVAGAEPPAPAYNAALVGMDHPATMIAGERAVAWVELRNTGTATWDLDRTRLGTTGPRDRESAFYDPENWLSPSRATPPDHSTYAPGSVGRFTFMIAAPAVTEERVITETFGLVQEGVTWFGPDDVRIEIRVSPAAEVPVDADGDGFAAGPDCDDSDPAVHPGVAEICGDGIDQDCNGVDRDCAEPPSPPPDDPGTTAPPPASDPPAGDPPEAGAAEPAEIPPTRSLSGGCSVEGGPSSSAGLLGALVLLALMRRRRV